MHQATIALGKSARGDVVVTAGAALAAAVPADSVGINIGSNPKVWGLVERDLNDCIEVMIRESRQGGGLLRANHAWPGVGGKAYIQLAATNALPNENALCVIRNTTGNLDGRTELVQEGLKRCLQQLKLACYAGLLAGVAK